MSNYKRVYIPGGMYFFTLVTYQRKSILCSAQAIKRLREAFYYTKQKYPFRTEALVVMPDHLHCVWQLPDNDANFSTRWNLIKRYFSVGFKSESNDRREKNIWQRRFWEHLIRDENDLYRHVDYIHYNPVKHGYVNKPYGWQFGTFRRDVAKGFYDAEWGSNEIPKSIVELDFE